MSSVNATSGFSFSELPASSLSDIRCLTSDLVQKPLIDRSNFLVKPEQMIPDSADSTVAVDSIIAAGRPVGAPGEKTVEQVPGQLTEAAEITQAIAQLTKGDFHRKWDSAKQFSKQFAQWGDKTIPHLIAALEVTTDSESQWFLIRVLSQYDRPEVVVALMNILATTPDEELQAETSKALTGLGESAIAHLADQLANHPKLDQRILAARTLAHIRRSAVLAPLLSVANDASETLRAIALEALGSFHDGRITPVLLAALEDTPAICLEAIRTLGRRRDLMETVDLIGPLAGCLGHSTEAVAKESAIALGRLGGKAATTALGECVLQPVPRAVKIAAVRSLGWMDSEPAVAYLAIAFNCAVPVVMPSVREEIARALGQMRSTTSKRQAAQPLLDWLKADEHPSSQSVETNESPEDSRPNLPPDNSFDNSSRVRLKQSVISALTRLAPSDAIDVLVPLLSDSDPCIQLHVLNALKQIDPRAAQLKVQAYLKGEGLSVKEKAQIVKGLQAW